MRKWMGSIGLLVLSFSTQADIWGVEDAVLISKAIEQIQMLQKQYQTLQQTYDNAKKELENGKSQLNSLNKIKDFNTGHYDFGNLKNSLSDLHNRQWSPDNWDDALKNIAGGNEQRYQQLVKAYKKSHPEIDSKRLEASGASKTQIKQIQQAQAVNQAVTVQTTYAYNDINTHLKTIHELSQKIEETENTKSAIDLNSRLSAEIAYIQVQALKLQTLISQQTAQMGAHQISETAEQINFNRLPDNP